MIRLLVISTLFPNSVQTRHGIFVETRLRHLVGSGKVSATVIAPVPWFPFDDTRFPNYVCSRRIPKKEIRYGISVYHPRYLAIPKIGMLVTPFFLALSILFQLMSLRRIGVTYDLVDSHYYYPDGVAVALLSSFLKAPFTVTARGTDINLIPRYNIPRRLILWAAQRAAASITVCQALKDEMVNLGADPERIHVFRNGVDLDLFKPVDRAVCKAEYGVDGMTLLTVGHLIERKGHDLVIKAMQQIRGANLLIAGDGEEQGRLEELAQRLGLADRIIFLGPLTQEQLVRAYNAADILILASSREGWANVLLESMACGTPVVATRIWGTPEVVKSAAAGRLVDDRTPDAIAETSNQLLGNLPDRTATRKYAESFSWQETTEGLISLFQTILVNEAGSKE